MQNLNKMMMILYVLIYVKIFFLIKFNSLSFGGDWRLFEYFFDEFFGDGNDVGYLCFLTDEIGCFVRLVKCASFVIL